jgi:hypothetical protein
MMEKTITNTINFIGDVEGKYFYDYSYSKINKGLTKYVVFRQFSLQEVKDLEDVGYLSSWDDPQRTIKDIAEDQETDWRCNGEKLERFPLCAWKLQVETKMSFGIVKE